MKAKKKVSDEQKLRGGYYTPKEITDFICSWAIKSKEIKVLEPSCGDGNFVESSIQRFLEVGVTEEQLYGKIKGVELIPAEAAKARLRTQKYGLNSDTIINDDFFSFLSNGTTETYDVVLGNPPFIRYQNFPEEHRTIAIQMMNEIGLKPNKLTNIWVPFLVISSSLLSTNGKLGMVIPAELFQVKYAAETRVFLSKFYQRITIITFKRLVFDGIQQEVVLLLCEKSVQNAAGIRVLQLDHLEDLNEINFDQVADSEVKNIEHSKEKWTKYFLDENEIDFLRKVKESKKIPVANKLIDVDVGIVTGRNNFFMLNQSQLNSWNLQNHTHKVVGKSKHLEGIIFEDEDFQKNLSADYPVHLFLPPNKEKKDLSNECKEYIDHGEVNDFHTGYKCRIRKKWYITPSIWNPGGYALRQIHEFPKLILNRVDASATDTIHRVRFISKEFSPESIVICFLNSLTFAFSEITGRSYGGGVMTFEPTEIEELLIPVVENHGIDLKLIDSLMREKRIEEVLDIVDEIVLVKHYGYSPNDVLKFRNIWKKLASRRIKRGKSARSKKKSKSQNQLLLW